MIDLLYGGSLRKKKEESHDETLDGPCYGVAGHAARRYSPRPRSPAPTFFSGSTSTPPTPAWASSPARRWLPTARARMPSPGANLANRNLTKAYLIGADLSAYYTDCCGTY